MTDKWKEAPAKMLDRKEKLEKLETMSAEYSKAIRDSTHWASKAITKQSELLAMKTEMERWKTEAKRLAEILSGKGERIASLNNELRDADQAIKEVISRKVRAIKEGADYRRKLAELETAVRALMDVTEYDGEGKESRDLRSYVSNASDIEAKIAAEGYKP